MLALTFTNEFKQSQTCLAIIPRTPQPLCVLVPSLLAVSWQSSAVTGVLFQDGPNVGGEASRGPGDT